jgi:homoserine kinase
MHEILKLRAPGLLGCTPSGAGPSILVLFEREYESVCDLVRQIFWLHGPNRRRCSPASRIAGLR